MMNGHRGREVRLIGLIGSESIGKTTTGYHLTGKLRAHGLLAEFVSDSSASMPFPPDRFDTHVEAWLYVLCRKVMRESEFALRSNVDTIISDRTPLDLIAYARMKHPDAALLAVYESFAIEAMQRYDRIYFFPAAGTAFRADEFREPTDDSRKRIDAYFTEQLPALTKVLPNLRVASGSYRARAEFVYHDALALLTGRAWPALVVPRMQAWLAERFPGLACEVQVMGSNSVTRVHPASDHDDIDLQVIVDGDADTTLRVRSALNEFRPILEPIVEADLHAWAVQRGHENNGDGS